MKEQDPLLPTSCRSSASSCSLQTETDAERWLAVQLENDTRHEGVDSTAIWEDEGDEVVQLDLSSFYKDVTQFTLRAVIVGVLVGGLLCLSNMYFGLQTGWVTMGSLQSSIIGFVIFRLFRCSSLFDGFTEIENVLLQTVAVSMATMPLAGGFVGIFQALSQMTPADREGGSLNLTWWQIILFSFGLAFLGIFSAAPLRKQVIVLEEMPFPSGTATAKTINMLHFHNSMKSDYEMKNYEKEKTAENAEKIHSWFTLGISFLVSSVFVLCFYFFPFMRNLPFMTWLGFPDATLFYWVLTPSFGYVGQGMLMGIRSSLSMFLGMIVGWAVLAPISKIKHWAPGPVSDLQTGALGWTLWVALSIMLAESIMSLFLVIWNVIMRRISISHKKKFLRKKDPVPVEHRIPVSWWSIGLILSMALCILCMILVFRNTMSFWQALVVVIFSVMVSVLAVRALGETDLNPSGGIGMIAQMLFVVLAPGNIAANIVAGGIASASALKAGDMIQSLKIGYLLHASPRAQLIGQLIGSFFSVFFAFGAYVLYTSAYQIPGPDFEVPAADVWLNMARALNGKPAATNVMWFCIGGIIFGGLLPIIGYRRPMVAPWLPSGVAFAMAMYITPNWTIPRVIGSLVQYIWASRWTESHDKYMIIVATGLVLGEGTMSIVTAILTKHA